MAKASLRWRHRISRKRTPAFNWSLMERFWHLVVPETDSNRAPESCVPGMESCETYNLSWKELSQLFPAAIVLNGVAAIVKGGATNNKPMSFHRNFCMGGSSLKKVFQNECAVKG